MEDKKIIELYFERSESAIGATAEKYGKLSHSVAKNILGSDADAEECVNDAYLALWDEIPPTLPRSLPAFLCKIVRNIALDKLDSKNAACRKGETLPILDEIADIVKNDDDRDFDRFLFTESLNRFLASEKKQSRQIFVRRYFYCDSVKKIADRYSIGEGRVRSSLYRSRIRLAEHLKKEDLLYE